MYNIGNQGKIMRKLLGKHAGDSTHDNSSGITSSPITSQPYRPSASQNAVFDAGASIGCMAQSPDGLSAVLAGSHVLKTVNLDGVTIKNGVDLRALITAQLAIRTGAATTTSASSISDQFSIRDVKWGGPGNGSIFTACANGRIFQYDLSRVGSGAAGGAGLEFIQIREECRQVNALDINPHRGTYLLSGSQDGRVRCFDIRMPVQTRAGLTFRAVQAFNCNADGVRHVQWSPKDGFYFACGTEQGIVIKWDIRKASAPMLRINAHTGDKTCSAIAWHPDGDHLMSAGWDSRCHVWDMSRTADKRQKPKWTLSTPAPVIALAWRPGQWSATAQARRAAQVAVSYGESNRKNPGIVAVHVWDLARPTMPFKEIQRFDTSPSALLWHNQDLLWTAGHDGLFNQCDMAFASKVIDRQAVSTMSFSSRGDVLMFLDERSPAHRPRPHALHPENIPTSSSYGSSPSTPLLSISHSDSEDDVVGSFLGPRRRGGRKRRPSTRSSHAISTTPPTAPGISEDLMLLSLEQAVKVTGTYRPQQAMAIGHVPAAATPDVYDYLATNYLETLYAGLPGSPGCPPLVDRVARILEHYARAAESVSQFRLAQTWRILAYGTELLLQRRAQYHYKVRMDRLRNPRRRGEHSGVHPFMVSAAEGSGRGRDTPRKVPSVRSLDRLGPRSLLSEEIESTSTVPTPLVHPVRDGADVDGAGGTEGNSRAPRKMLTPIIEPESFTLPPAILPQSFEKRRRLDSVPLSVMSQDSEVSRASQSSIEGYTEGYDFYDTEAIIAQAIDVPAPRRKPILTHNDFVEPSSPNRRRSVARHDSDESFAQVFSDSDGGGSRYTPSSLTEPAFGNIPRRAGSTARMETLIEHDNHNQIRGKQLENDSPVREQQHQHLPFRQPLARTETDLTGFTGFTGFTDEQQVLTQTTTDSFDSPEDRFLSQTDTVFGSFRSPQRRLLNEGTNRPGIEDDWTPHIIDTDYLYWPGDPPYPFPPSSEPEISAKASQPQTPLLLPPSPPPLQPYSLIARALAFEVKTSALNASAMVLLLKPFVPDDVIDPFQAAAILRQHHTRLMGMKLFVEAALLRKLCVKGWPASVSGNSENNSLAECWGDNYAAVFTPAQHGVQVGLLCSNCHKPREVDHMSGSTETAWRCERCRAVMAPCAVCGHREAAPIAAAAATLTVADGVTATAATGRGGNGHDGNSDRDLDLTILATWWYCPGCAHGGHSACMQAWHAATLRPPDPHGNRQGHGHDDPPHSYALTPGIAEFSGYGGDGDGCCPLDGCGHACLPGRWRAESAAARTEEVSRAAVREATARAAAMAAAVVRAPGGDAVGDSVGSLFRGSTVVSSFDSSVVDRQDMSFEGGIGTGTVRGEPWNDVVQSRAVESAREALAGADYGVAGISDDGTGTASPASSNVGSVPGIATGFVPGRGTGSGLTAGIPGFGIGAGGEAGKSGRVAPGSGEHAERVTGRRERERRKSVKFVALDTEG